MPSGVYRAALALARAEAESVRAPQLCCGVQTAQAVQRILLAVIRSIRSEVHGDISSPLDGRAGCRFNRPKRCVMTTLKHSGTVLAAVAVLTLGGCETNRPTVYENPSSSSTQNLYSGYGVVQSMELVQQGSNGNTGSNVGIGTVAGAVAGGLLGSRIGGGTGQLAATAAGVAGGAYAGHAYDNRQRQQTADVYRYNIRMDNGSYQSVTQDAGADLRVGDRVRIENNLVQRY
jgi:outer membrane lipoprotein SlyB